MNIIDHPSPNYWNASNPIEAIVLHGTDGSLGSALGWLTNRKSGVSSNYLIGENGKIYRLVAYYQGKRAWANGVVINPDPAIKWLAEAVKDKLNPNLVTISIEHEASDYSMKHQGRMTDLQWRSSQDLVKKLLADNNLVASGQTVLGHYQIDSKNKSYCPGVINVPAYIEKLLEV